MTLEKIPTPWDADIAAWALSARAAGHSVNTVNSRSQHLRHASKGLGTATPWEVAPDALIAWCGGQDWAPDTRRGRRNTFRAFWTWGESTGRATENPARELPTVRPAPPRPKPAPDTVYQRALLAATPREMLILRLAALHGLRRAEVAQGHRDDLFEDLGGWSLVVHGKGRKERTVPLGDALASELRALPYGFFFPGRRNGHLSPEYVGKLITRLMPDTWTMHTLRHKFATAAYAVEKDLFVVQDLLGHASPATTRAYVVVPRENLRRTVNAVGAA